MTAVEPDSPRAWVAAIAAASAQGMAFGTAYTFGTFFDSMAEEFGANRGSTAVIFGLTLLFFFGFGVISGPLSDRVGVHRLLAVGGTIFVTGLLVTSRVHDLYLGYLTYGVAVGLGSGMFTAPLTAHVGRLFGRRRTLALGVIAAGSGTGTMTLVPLSARLIERHGWRTAYVVLALIAAVVFALAVPAVRVPRALGQTADASIVERLRGSARLLRDRFFATMFAATLLMSVGLFIAFGFIVTFAKDQGIAPDRASRLMSGCRASSGAWPSPGWPGGWAPCGCSRLPSACSPSPTSSGSPPGGTTTCSPCSSSSSAWPTAASSPSAPR
jgi:MFS family permease